MHFQAPDAIAQGKSAEKEKEMKEIIDSAIKYLSTHPDVVVNIGITFVGVVISAIVTSIVTCTAVDWLRCKTARRVAKAIMLTFKEEIKIGVDVLDEYIKNGSSVVMMPTQTFDSYTFTTDIIEVIIGKAHKMKKSAGFPPEEFLIHLKNYYGYICVNVNNAIAAKGAPPMNATAGLLNPAKGVLCMVERIINSLA